MMITREMAEAVARRVEKRLEGTSCAVVEKLKNNGVKAIGISVKKTDCMAAPMFHLDDAMDGAVEKMADMIVERYESISEEELESIEKTELITRKTILDKVVFKVVNAKWNAELLERLPHFEMLNLAVIYNVPLGMDKDGLSKSTKVTNEVTRNLEISDHELYEAAQQNTAAYYGFEVINMAQMFENAGIELMQPTKPLIYVCTGKNRIDAATIMLYPQYFKEIAKKEKTDLYIIPSSIHEVLALPAKRIDPHSLKNMCNEVNAEQVPTEEQLGNTIYRYRRLTNDFVISC